MCSSDLTLYSVEHAKIVKTLARNQGAKRRNGVQSSSEDDSVLGIDQSEHSSIIDTDTDFIKMPELSSSQNLTLSKCKLKSRYRRKIKLEPKQE